MVGRRNAFFSPRVWVKASGIAGNGKSLPWSKLLPRFVMCEEPQKVAHLPDATQNRRITPEISVFAEQNGTRVEHCVGCGHRTGKETSTTDVAVHTILPSIKLSIHLQ